MKPLKKWLFPAIFIVFALLIPFAGGFFYFSKVIFLELKAEPALQETDEYRQAQRKIKDYLKTYRGRAMGKLDLKSIAEGAARIYPAAEVYALRRFPNRLIVFLKQSAPSLLLLKGKGDFYSVFSDGSVRAQRSWNQSLDFPLLRGKSFWESEELRKQAADFMSSLPDSGWLRAENISEILYNKKNGSFVFFLMPKNFVLEAKSPVSAQKVKNINFVLEYLYQKERSQKDKKQKGNGGYRVNAMLEKKIIVSSID